MQINEYIQETIEHSIVVKQKVLQDEALLKNLAKVAEYCVQAYQKGNKLMFAGNGGSAGDSQHLAAELVCRFEKNRPGLPSIALTTDASMLTAIGNDFGYRDVFKRQLEANGRAGDVFFGISTSGNSDNILAAISAAKAMDITTVALCGEGGKIQDLADFVLAVPDNNTARIQESHILMGHIICGVIEQNLFND